LSLAGQIIERLRPRPTCAFLLEIPAEQAYERKEDVFSLEQVRKQEYRYGYEAARLGVIRLDATKSIEEVFADAAVAVWRRLP
jgi:thymidylate kinase